MHNTISIRIDKDDYESLIGEIKDGIVARFPEYDDKKVKLTVRLLINLVIKHAKGEI